VEKNFRKFLNSTSAYGCCPQGMTEVIRKVAPVAVLLMLMTGLMLVALLNSDHFFKIPPWDLMGRKIAGCCTICPYRNNPEFFVPEIQQGIER